MLRLGDPPIHTSDTAPESKAPGTPAASPGAEPAALTSTPSSAPAPPGWPRAPSAPMAHPTEGLPAAAAIATAAAVASAALRACVARCQNTRSPGSRSVRVLDHQAIMPNHSAIEYLPMGVASAWGGLLCLRTYSANACAFAGRTIVVCKQAAMPPIAAGEAHVRTAHNPPRVPPAPPSSGCPVCPCP